MRRAVLLLRPTAPLRSRHNLALRPTRALYIHPLLARLIIAGGILVFQAFTVAHNREAKRLQEEAEGTSPTDTLVGGGNACAMSSSEALQVLGLDSNLDVPLRSEKDRQEAQRRFRHLFAIARESDNLYLQGKFSAAYRLCVDAEWDTEVAALNGQTNDSSFGNNDRNI